MSLFSGLLLALVTPQLAHAIWLNPCPFGGCGYLPTIIVNITLAAITAFGGFLIAMFVWYGVKLLLTTADDSAQTDVRKAFVYAIFGTTLVAGAFIISGSFTSGGTLIDTAAIDAGILTPLKLFVEGLVGIALIINITFQGARLILSEDEGQATAARKRFIEGLIGVIVVSFADKIVDAFLPSGNATMISGEIAGIARFLATLFGVLAVVAIIVGGFFLVGSVQESWKEKGKQTIIAALVALAVVWSAYGIVTIFID